MKAIFKNGRMVFDCNLNVDINPSSEQFLYLQVKNVLKQAILNGEFEKGGKLPSARDIGKGNTISLATAERAYRDLRREGIIVRRKGDGYFVSESLDSMRS
ncbi:GntR family transcriptional regulator [Niabella ginsengisoli]|uniref:GntR family transcriptional regulator n=1 Tax=Niabella ginsengisoli TaxID=522298 RepID=A0ABS9SQW3_9BACT|nr:GntR family transcriptional regulator [Niabella ginsengisoli]MCH5600788.1 GntR family transcriptional regulator [Niabella ginsengisoli]